MVYIQGNKPQSEMTATPDKYPQGYFKRKECKWCNTVFEPQAPSHLFCSQECVEANFDDKYLRKTYGISRNTYYEMLEQQDHLCAICGLEGWTMAKHHKLKLVVDHDHQTGEVRGLLCHNCNRGLGLFKDSKENLHNAYEYLGGATTIPEGSTSQAIGDGSVQLSDNSRDDDIV